MVDERPAPLMLNEATNLSDVMLVDEFVEVAWKKMERSTASLAAKSRT